MTLREQGTPAGSGAAPSRPDRRAQVDLRGVTVSYFEWVQDREEFFWTIDEINARLRRVMVRAYEDVQRTAIEHDVDLRLAAYMLSVSRVAEATLTRGIYP